jgi:hypothetical protein
MQYPALPKAAGVAAVRALLQTVRPSGLLVAVHHDLQTRGESPPSQSWTGVANLKVAG